VEPTVTGRRVNKLFKNYVQKLFKNYLEHRGTGTQRIFIVREPPGGGENGTDALSGGTNGHWPKGKVYYSKIIIRKLLKN
jgi:hypothetical protein